MPKRAARCRHLLSFLSNTSATWWPEAELKESQMCLSPTLIFAKGKNFRIIMTSFEKGR